MAKSKPKMVHCRYPKCYKLHESTELLKDDAVKAGSKSSYYHPDCYHTMQTVNKIRDTFVKEINPLLTGKQIGVLVSTINNMIFNKGIDVDLILFALEYFVKYKPGCLHQPFGLHYIVQDKDVMSAWKKEQGRKLREEIKAQIESTIDPHVEINFSLPVHDSSANKSNNTRFSKVLGV